MKKVIGWLLAILGVANIFKVGGGQCALDGALGADIHKYRGLHGSVGACKLSPPGAAFLLYDSKQWIIS